MREWGVRGWKWVRGAGAYSLVFGYAGDDGGFSFEVEGFGLEGVSWGE